MLAGAVSVTGLVLGLSLSFRQTSSLAYQGKPLGFWFNQLPLTGLNGKMVVHSRQVLLRSPSEVFKTYGDWVETPETTAQAIRGIGTNALVFYLEKLSRHYGVLEQRITKVAHAVGYNGLLFADVYPERRQAVTALILLKPLPPGVISALVTLSRSRNLEIAAAARCALTIKEDELVFLHPPAFKGTLDLDLLELPKVSDCE